MTNDYKELIEYLDTKFTHIDEKFTHIDKQFSDVRTDFNDLQIAVDGYAKKADIYFQEMLVLARRIDRMEKWMKEIADKVGVKLEF